MPPSQLRLPKKSDENMINNDFIGTLCKQKHKNNNEHCYSYQHSLSIKQAKFVTQNLYTAAVAQSFRAFASQAEGLVFESEPRLT